MHTPAAIDAARRKAKSGDETARAFLANLELPRGVTAADLVHDCPECRAAMARGEKPLLFDPPEPEPMNRHGFRFKRPRWRDLKRVVRR